MSEVAVRTPQQELVSRIRSKPFREQVALALPGGVNPDRFVRATVTAIMQNPQVAEAEPDSIFRSALRCAQDGLLPDGREAAIVTFRNRQEGTVEATYIPMVSGLRKVAAKAGLSLAAHVVYANDTFSYQLGLEPTITHVPPPLGQERGPIIGAYAVATQRETGEKFLDVMSKPEIDKTRKVSRASDRGPWVEWYDEMARKTVARRLFKQLPLGDLDEQAERIVRQADADVELDAVDADEQAAIAAATVPRVPVDPLTEDRQHSAAHLQDETTSSPGDNGEVSAAEHLSPGAGDTVVESPLAAAEPAGAQPDAAPGEQSAFPIPAKARGKRKEQGEE